MNATVAQPFEPRSDTSARRSDRARGDRRPDKQWGGKEHSQLVGPLTAKTSTEHVVKGGMA